MSIVGWLLVAAGVVVGVVIAAEIVLRVMGFRLHPLTEWQNWEMQHKVAAADLLAERGGASVVAVGSSMVNAAIDPDLLSAKLNRNRPAFNGGLNGAGVRLLELWTLRILMPRLKPEIVVIGLGSHEMSKGNTVARRQFDALLSSRAWGDIAGHETARSRFVHWAEKRSYLFRYRRHIGKRSLFRDTPTRRNTACRRLGTLRGLLLFRERAYSIDDRQLPIWKELVRDFEVGDEETAALGRLLDGIRAAGATPLLIRMPVTEDWVNLHPRGRSDFESFERALAATARGHAVPLIDLTNRLSFPDDYADPVHMNGKGMMRFTELLASVLDDLPVGVQS